MSPKPHQFSKYQRPTLRKCDPVSRIASIVTLVIVGVVIADILTHADGVKAASAGFAGIERPALNALLGRAA